MELTGKIIIFDSEENARIWFNTILDTKDENKTRVIMQKDIFLCGKTPYDEDIYTDGEKLYKIDGETCYQYFGKVVFKADAKDWKGIVGTCKA